MSQAIDLAAGSALDVRRIGGGQRLLRAAKQNPMGAVAAGILTLVMVGAVFAPLLSPYAYDKANVLARLQGPSSTHLLGTDSLGRDVLSRIIYGARISAVLSLMAVTIASAIAITFGLLSGYLRGWFDILVQRLVDVLLAFPGIILVISLTLFLGKGLPQLAFSISILLIAGSTRICRGATLQVRSQPYVEAAISLGVPTHRILIRHILPNVFAPLMVIATGQLGFAILIEATASFLGYGVREPFPSWGRMLSGDARAYAQREPLLAVWPGLAIFLTVYALNMLGDTLRDVLDPRLRGKR